jgi:hypothetical protein
MPRGGKREGAGSKPKWKHGKTRTIRVPVELADQILELAKKLDQGEALVCRSEIQEIAKIDYDTESKVIDLTGVSLISISGQMGVKLKDLILRGYHFKPDRLNQILLMSLSRK